MMIARHQCPYSVKPHATSPYFCQWTPLSYFIIPCWVWHFASDNHHQGNRIFSIVIDMCHLRWCFYKQAVMTKTMNCTNLCGIDITDFILTSLYTFVNWLHFCKPAHRSCIVYVKCKLRHIYVYPLTRMHKCMDKLLSTATVQSSCHHQKHHLAQFPVLTLKPYSNRIWFSIPWNATKGP